MTVPAKSQSLFQKQHELLSLVKSLKKLNKKALEVLEKALSSTDEKIRVMAADKLLKFYCDTAKEIDQSQLNRLILDIKASGLIGQGSTAEDDSTPQLDFDHIHKDFRTEAEDAENVVEMVHVNKI